MVISPPLAQLLARRLIARRNQRGAAIFVVVLVLTLLSAMGVFAIRAGSLAELSSGYDRQNAQNHYVAEYGMLTAVSELGTPRRNAYLRMMNAGTETCTGQSDAGAVSPPPACMRLYASDVQNVLRQGQPSLNLFEPPAAGLGGTQVPGSLGAPAVTGDFVVEMTDPGPVGTPVAGTDVGGTGSRFKYVQVTLSTTGQVRPTCAANDTTCQQSAASLAGNETGRAFVVVGPVP